MKHVVLAVLTLGTAAAEPLKLHPENGHYFWFRGRPSVLVTSGEHYGAVLNRAFDFRKYLATLEADGLNLTRAFSGCYAEPPGAFGIAGNTLAPGTDDFIAPWQRTDGKFDLVRWDPDYFARLEAFLEEADRRGVVVEFVLFCPMYTDGMWERSPMNAKNNVNGVGTCPLGDVYVAEKSGGLFAYQKALAAKLVTELNRFDNLYFEVTNEPYIDQKVPGAFEDAIIEVIVETERSLPKQHLISLNIANGKAEVKHPNPAVSIFNFHYAHPPVTVTMNYGLGKVIGDNETGFRGQEDAPYRREAWAFMLAGGGLFNHLDYSFAVGFEDGSFAYPESNPGGGNAGLRKQLAFLKQFLEENAVWELSPIPGAEAQGADAWVLGATGTYVAYLLGDSPRSLTLPSAPAGSYQIQWSDAIGGKAMGDPVAVAHGGGALTLTCPGAVGQEIAVRATLSDSRP